MLDSSRRRMLAVLAFGAALTLVGCTRASLTSVASATSGSSCEVDGLGIGSGGLYVEAGRPALSYGTLTRQGRTEIAYVLVIRRVPGADDAFSTSVDDTVHCDAERVEAVTRIRLGDVELDFEHAARIDQATASLQDEELAIEGRAVDLALGRVFLADEGAPLDPLVQLDVPLPAPPAADAEPMQAARALLAELAARDAKVAEHARR